MIKKIAIIIPAYNEEKCIADVVRSINGLNMGAGFIVDVLVINDASSDETVSIAAGLDCILLDLPVNVGIGGAVQTGFKYAYEQAYDYAMQVDGDGQHPASEIPKLINAICTGEFNVVIGSRFIEKTGFLSTFYRRLGISFFKNLIKLFYGITVKDTTSGFRIIDNKALAIVSEYYPDEYPEPESIVLYKKYQLKIGEVPVKMKARQGGTTSIRAFYSLYYMMKVTIAIFFTSLRLRKINLK